MCVYRQNGRYKTELLNFIYSTFYKLCVPIANLCITSFDIKYYATFIRIF